MFCTWSATTDQQGEKTLSSYAPGLITSASSIELHSRTATPPASSKMRCNHSPVDNVPKSVARTTYHAGTVVNIVWAPGDMSDVGNRRITLEDATPY
jgi:hypothetical protein